MGWLYGWNSKAELVAHLNAGLTDKYTLIKSVLVGNHHWQLVESNEGAFIGPGKRFICLNLLASSRDGWGYKDMDETMQPYHYDCPLSLLKIAGEPVNEQAKSWREKVKQHHAVKDKVKTAKAKIGPGSIINLYGTDYKLELNLGRRGWNASRVSDGYWFRVTSRQVNEALSSMAGA